MLNQDKKQEIVVNYSIDKVFDAIIRAAEGISQFKIKNANIITHTVTINVRASMFSWGEIMSVSLQEIEKNKTGIMIASGSKLGTEIASNSKNRKNIDTLMNAMSYYLGV